MTGAYDPVVAELVSTGWRNYWVAYVNNATDGGGDLQLDVVEVEVSLDETWSPYVQGTLRAVVPSDQAVLDALDPRKLVRVELQAGYYLPNGTIDVHPLATGFLRHRSVDRPGDLLELSWQGKEYLYDSWLPLYAGEGWNNRGFTPSWGSDTIARDAVTRCLLACGAIAGTDSGGWDYGDNSWDYAGAMQSSGWANNADPWVPAEEQPLDVARDIAGRIDGWFRCDEEGVWKLTVRPRYASKSAHTLVVGDGGTVLASRTGLSREDWANAVRVQYRWSGGTSNGYAQVSEGPYLESQVGRVLASLDVPFKGSAAVAAARAKASLTYRLSRGRSMELDATAAYWLRPGHTVTVQLPTGPQERHLVSAVTWRLHEGSMTVTTRVPDPA